MSEDVKKWKIGDGRPKGAKDLKPRANPETRILTKKQGRPIGPVNPQFKIPEHMLRMQSIKVKNWIYERLKRKLYPERESINSYLEDLILKDNPTWQPPER